LALAHLVSLDLRQIDLVLVLTEDLSQTFLEGIFAIFISFLYWVQDASGFMSTIVFLFIFQPYSKALMGCLITLGIATIWDLIILR
jgi:hypothetical protein